jgi:hypothetical protein
MEQVSFSASDSYLTLRHMTHARFSMNWATCLRAFICAWCTGWTAAVLSPGAA